MNLRISTIVLFLTSVFLQSKCQGKLVPEDEKRMQFKVAEFKKSCYVSVEDDFILSCDLVKIKEYDPGNPIKKKNRDTKEKLEIQWFRWEDQNDLSFQLNKGEDCTRYLYNT